jgi:hypothetical protein
MVWWRFGIGSAILTGVVISFQDCKLKSFEFLAL